VKIKDILTHGIQFKINVGGKAFNPHFQKRTSWQDDLIKNKKENNYVDNGHVAKVQPKSVRQMGQ
jgi:hypothetical protein